MAWVTATYLNSAIGASQVSSLGLTSGSDRLTQFELEARATVQSVLQYAGYNDFTETLTETTETQKVTAAFLKGLCAALMIQTAMELIPGIELGSGVEAFVSRNLSKLDAVYSKKLPVPGAQPSSPEVAYGGVKFNTSDTPRRFNLRGTSF